MNGSAYTITVHFGSGLDLIFAVLFVLLLGIIAVVIALNTRNSRRQMRRRVAGERDATLRAAHRNRIAASLARPVAWPIKACNCTAEKNYICFACRTSIQRDAEWMGRTALNRVHGHWKCKVVLEGSTPTD